MKKLTLLLIGELRRLGMTVVYATFGRLVVHTNKRDCRDARAYARFVVAALAKKDLFASLGLSLRRAWSLLYWMDSVVVYSVFSLSDAVQEGILLSL